MLTMKKHSSFTNVISTQRVQEKSEIDVLTCDQIDSPASVKSSKPMKSRIIGITKTYSVVSNLEVRR